LKINKSIFKYIEHEMYSYDDLKRELKLYREQIIEGTGSQEPGMSVQSGLADTTQSKAVKLTSSKFVLNTDRIIKAIERSLELLDERHRELFELKYQKGLPWQEVSAEMCISDRTYFRVRRELVTVIGQQLGLVNVER